MNRSQFNTGIFFLEGTNALATAFFFNYLFFFLKEEHGFSNMQNLLVCALNGLIFMPCALYGGKYGQKYGYINALVLGFIVMAAGLAAGAIIPGVTSVLVSMCIWTVGMCFTWPNMEALVCDKMDPAKLPGVIGIYNVVWSGGSALAYFFGGAVAERYGWGSMFWIPAATHVLQIGVALWLKPHWQRICSRAPEADAHALNEGHPEGAKFLRMAWVANPFAYIAINAVIPLIPDVANKLQLSPKYAGFFCSIWFFSRTLTFVALALWNGWHYRFSYLVSAYIGMFFCFGGMLVLTDLWAVVAVQIGFGWCLGLIYYSSLYYSMHVGETKGEHGGVHEAVIGAGIFGGPAIGAASLALFPAARFSSVIGVALFLGVGLGALLVIRRNGKTGSL